MAIYSDNMEVFGEAGVEEKVKSVLSSLKKSIDTLKKWPKKNPKLKNKKSKGEQAKPQDRLYYDISYMNNHTVTIGVDVADRKDFIRRIEDVVSMCNKVFDDICKPYDDGYKKIEDMFDLKGSNNVDEVKKTLSKLLEDIREYRYDNPVETDIENSFFYIDANKTEYTKDDILYAAKIWKNDGREMQENLYDDILNHIIKYQDSCYNKISSKRVSYESSDKSKIRIQITCQDALKTLWAEQDDHIKEFIGIVEDCYGDYTYLASSYIFDFNEAAGKQSEDVK